MLEKRMANRTESAKRIVVMAFVSGLRSGARGVECRAQGHAPR